MNSRQYIIRELLPSEYHLLETFLYEAIFQRDEQNLLPREIINEPSMQVYIEGFGRASDNCLVAETDGEITACVWTRIIAGKVRGFGNIDGTTPEFAISVLKPYRGTGIGTALMKAMLDLLKQKGYARASLAVQKDNYAVKMYKNNGFEITDETEEEYIMVRIL